MEVCKVYVVLLLSLVAQQPNPMDVCKYVYYKKEVCSVGAVYWPSAVALTVLTCLSGRFCTM